MWMPSPSAPLTKVKAPPLASAVWLMRTSAGSMTWSSTSTRTMIGLRASRWFSLRFWASMAENVTAARASAWRTRNFVASQGAS